MTRHPAFAEREPIYRELIPASFDARRVLDVGATAASVSFLRELLPGARVTACNVRSEDLVAVADDFAVCRAEELVYPDDTFDLVFAGEVLEHLLYPNEFLDRAAAVLRRDGLLLLSTPNLTAWHNRLLVAFGYSPSNYSMLPDRPVGLPALLGRRLGHGYGDHVRVFGFRALREVFDSDPWELVGVRGQNCRATGRAFRLVRRLADVLPPALREDVFVCARNSKRPRVSSARSGGFVGTICSVTPRSTQ
jgi:SAM-dependent methyltransferase